MFPKHTAMPATSVVVTVVATVTVFVDVAVSVAASGCDGHCVCISTVDVSGDVSGVAVALWMWL